MRSRATTCARRPRSEGTLVQSVIRGQTIRTQCARSCPGTSISSICREPRKWVVKSTAGPAPGIFVVRRPSLARRMFRHRPALPGRLDHARSTCSFSLIRKHVRWANVTGPPSFPCIQDPGKGHTRRRPTRSAEQTVPFGDAFPNGEISPPTLLHSELCGEVSFVPRRAALPEFGGSRQPLDRQVRYYSDGAQQASRVFWYFSGRRPDRGGWWSKNRSRRKAPKRQPPRKVPVTPKRHSPVEGRLGFALVTGLSNKWGGSCPPSANTRLGFP